MLFTIQSSVHALPTRFEPLYVSMYLIGPSDGTVSHFSRGSKFMGEPLYIQVILNLFQSIKSVFQIFDFFYFSKTFFKWKHFHFPHLFSGPSGKRLAVGGGGGGKGGGTKLPSTLFLGLIARPFALPGKIFLWLPSLAEVNPTAI